MKRASQASVGAEIKRRREEQGLTLTELGARADVHPHHLSAIEKGRNDLGLPVLERVAKALGVLIAELLGPLPKISEKGLTAGYLFDKIDPETQRGVLAILHGTATIERKARSKKTAKRAKRTR